MTRLIARAVATAIVIIAIAWSALYFLRGSSKAVVNDAGERISGGDAFDLYVGLSQPDDRSAELMGMSPLHAVIRL